MRKDYVMLTKIRNIEMMQRSQICLVLAILFSLATTPAIARSLIVLANPQAPYKFEENDRASGIDVEVLELFAKQEKIDFNLKFISSDARILEESRHGRADMLLLFSKKISRMEFLTYPSTSYVNITWNFFIRSSDKDRIRFESLKDLGGLKVGATNSIAYTPEFLTAGLDLDFAPINSLQIKKLLQGRIDIVPMNTINTLYEENRKGNLHRIKFLAKPLKQKPYYNVFSKNSDYPNLAELIKKYEKFIIEKKNDGTIQQIIRKYLGTYL